MEINPHQLQIFVAVARERSFSWAAEKLHISQPSVSIQIRKLENSLDLKLFERTRYDVRLTAEGVVVLEHAERMFSAVDDLESAVQKFKKSQRDGMSKWDVAGNRAPGWCQCFIGLNSLRTWELIRIGKLIQSSSF